MVYAIFTFIALGIAGGYFFLGLEHKDLLAIPKAINVKIA